MEMSRASISIIKMITVLIDDYVFPANVAYKSDTREEFAAERKKKKKREIRIWELATYLIDMFGTGN